MSQGFSDFGFNKQLLNAIADLGYEDPTPIQQKALPPALNGQHVMGIAQTGTGKTAAYVLPMLMKLRYAQGDEPRALVVVPTRELAMQVSTNISQLGCYTDLRHMAVYGGLGPKTQKEALAKGIDILIATPGRLLELYSEGHVVLKKVQYFVMDEADRLVDMGFIRQIHSILEIIRQKKQCLLFSATMSPLVRKIADDFLEFPIVVEVEPEQKTAVTVSQGIYKTPNLRTKMRLLSHLLTNEKVFNKVMVFCRKRTTADNVEKYIRNKFGDESCRVIHANKGQNTRINSMGDFKDGQVRILVATDVAARGIDVASVSHVINFEVPVVYEDYVHRIGRTGRALQEGASLTFVNEAEEYHIKKIEKLIKQQIPEITVPRNLIEEETSYEERQAMAREIDAQKRKEDPEFKGAFHEKKPIKKKERVKGDKRKYR